MLTYPEIDPVVFALGPLKVHWYGVMYLIAFWFGWWLGRLRAARKDSGWTPEQVDDLVFYIVLGVVLGGRLGYMLFYGWPRLIEDPLMLLRVWEGGMAFHGGLLGVITAMWLFARKHNKPFFEATDFLAPLVPTGLAAGRIGNFINAELWGAPTSQPWGMQVSCQVAPDLCSRVGSLAEGLYSVPVHPNQLYEFLLEGVLLFLVLWLFSLRPRPRMAASGLFLLSYGIFRSLIELVRMPDAHIGYLAFDWLTMGQLLSLPMIIAGAILILLAYRNRGNLEG
ncbi:prolipoprotein diacylglyceryl transferase [endosymbiont of Ridgeia piscesae]|jgi:phosphatidylglycerol:prolipoprotein diacylglycerol transferase|uniref:Phosphatidylglycerol--prolipoprotein diacylglyceryl transferase n=1 Tax=endosymbiont of Ridgeia piscesae TaxID=54398 RepID=A0A0T5Z3Q4_9GAMM|nr:prolipoprotein diacylglyceryl transferase [endosymbiont of Ridgeia piscesae]KRT53760.1 prolipoprotein diacylglyceryl transferase [endosymbiont of Ridgeia piscesae]KRT57508.1 phosphatidylglycerol:prolipoprotein diacylglycerol transferase [endosymbiont of Ridgeia piscesae]